jgi:hypothetical protein
MIDQLNQIRKALVAAAVPGLVLALNDVVVELDGQWAALVAVVLAGVATWATPNQPAD